MKRNALWVMFAVFYSGLYFFFRAETPTKRAKTPTKQAKTPEMRFSCKTVNFFNTVIYQQRFQVPELPLRDGDDVCPTLLAAHDGNAPGAVGLRGCVG